MKGCLPLVFNLWRDSATIQESPDCACRAELATFAGWRLSFLNKVLLGCNTITA